MLYVIRDNTDPYFNLAAEEYFLKNFDDDIFMLWQNSPCIIVGKHQNTLAEINIDYVERNNLSVVRRISGGGAVYHDTGNLNFTFIQNGTEGDMVNFRKFTRPIIDALARLGLAAKFEGRNDITIEGKKVSGNAEHVFKNRVLHHGTLLFSSELSELQNALKVQPGKFRDKSVKSVRSRVANISGFLNESITIDEFKESVKQNVLSSVKDVREYRLTEKDIEGIEKLKNERYITWNWNFAYSPKYNFNKSEKLKGGTIEVYMDVKNGHIRKMKIFGDFFGNGDLENFESVFIGLPHNRQQILKKLQGIDIQKYFNNITKDEIINCMF